jgi:hypothetical protein
MPPDINTWTTSIIENISRKVPEIPQYIAGIDFNKVDPIVGDADGLVYLMGGLAAIPVTIRQNRLAPLDILVTKNEEFYPVSEAFLQKVYADNVIGETSNAPGRQDDLQEDGPARQIKYYNTVDKVKQASYDKKIELRSAIEKSAKLLTFFDKHRPEILSVLYTAQPDAVKVASSVAPAPDVPNIHFLAREGDAYTFNSDNITTKQAAELMEAFGMTNEEKASLLQGGHVCMDYREKHATVVQGGAMCSSSCGDSGTSIATVLTLDGVPAKGVLHRTTAGEYSGQLQRTYHSGYRHLFIAPDFHSIQDDLYIIDQTPTKVEDVVATMTPTEPMIGMFGVVASQYSISMPLQVSSVQKFGKICIIKALTHELDPCEHTLGRGSNFYVIPEERKSLVRNADDAMLTMPGRNYTLGLNGEGCLVISGESVSHTNAVYSLMNKMAMEYDDAVRIVDTATRQGRVTFKVAEDKSDDKKKPDFPDKKEESSDKPKDGEKPPEDDAKTPPKDTDAPQGEPPQEEQSGDAPPGDRPVEEQPQEGAPQGEPISPEQAAEEQAAVDQQQISAAQQQGAAVEQMPVQSEDLEDIAKINDPTLMDAYLSGKLTDVNTAGREQMMQASDAIVNGIKAVGKVLFLVRLGKVDYVKEEDAQMALNKLSDVARSIGVASSQLM